MNLRQTLKLATLAGAFALTPVPAQQAAGPVLGLVVDDANHQLRELLGVPGAAVLGPPIDLGAGVSPRAAAPLGSYVVVTTGETLGVLTPGSNPRTLDGLPAAATKIFFSPKGTAAGFYYEAERLIRTVSGLPGAPSAISKIPLDALNGAPQTIAVSDDGSVVLAAAHGHREAGVFTVAGQVNRILLGAQVEAVAFVPGARDGVVAGGEQTAVVRNVETPSQQLSLQTPGLKDLSAVAIATDGLSIYLASRTGRIAMVDVDGNRAPALLDCACAPDRLLPLNDHFSYRLTGYSGEPVRLLDGSAQSPRIVSAPPPLNTGTQQ